MERLVFSYGSNLYMPRLIERVESAKLLGACVLPKHQLKFNKLSKDGSGKANVMEHPDYQVWGSVCVLSAEAMKLLDKYEELGVGYLHKQVDVFTLEGNALPAITYMATPEKEQDGLKPYQWYKNYIIEGGTQLGLPKAYLEQLKAVETIKDSNEERINLNVLNGVSKT